MTASGPQQADAPNELELCQFPGNGKPTARIYACGGDDKHYASLRIEYGAHAITMTPEAWVDLAREVEKLRIQLAACGVIAMCNTPESAKAQRPKDDSPYWCASLRDVAAAVDREMELRRLAGQARTLLETTLERLDVLSYPEQSSRHAAVTHELMLSSVRIASCVRRMEGKVDHVPMNQVPA